MAGVGRGKNYTDPELKQLCLSVLHISQDPAIGNGQRAEKFWDRVQEHYNHHRPAKGKVRGKKSLEGKWADIKHDVSKFIGCYQQVEGRLISGTNEEDTLIQAKELYKENHPKGKSFNYESAWAILKECPRWHTPADDMARPAGAKKMIPKRTSSNQKESENDSPEIISTSEGDNEEAGDSANGMNTLRRPVGNKRAKEDVKRARLQDDVMRISAEAQKEAAAATKDMARANFMRARTMQNNSAIALLSLPIDTMDPELQAFMKDWKLEEARNLKKRMQSDGEGLPTSFAGQCSVNPATDGLGSHVPSRPNDSPTTQVLPAMFPTRPVSNLAPGFNDVNPLPSVRSPLPTREGVEVQAEAGNSDHENVTLLPAASSLLRVFADEDHNLSSDDGAQL